MKNSRILWTRARICIILKYIEISENGTPTSYASLFLYAPVCLSTGSLAYVSHPLGVYDRISFYNHEELSPIEINSAVKFEL